MEYEEWASPWPNTRRPERFHFLDPLLSLFQPADDLADEPALPDAADKIADLPCSAPEAPPQVQAVCFETTPLFQLRDTAPTHELA